MCTTCELINCGGPHSKLNIIMMNVQRSPQKRTPTSGGSQPDLSKISCITDDPQITLRKRKQPIDRDCECSYEFKEMRSELNRVSTLLEKYVESNEHILSKMQESIAEVQTQISEIKKSNEETNKSLRDNVIEVKTELHNLKKSSTIMFTEHKDTKNKITELEVQVNNKIKSIEDYVNKLNPQCSANTDTQLYYNEQIIREVQDRRNREKNIILVGLSEQISASADEIEVLKITSSIDPNIQKPVRIFRIGKYNPQRSRSLKVCFDSPIPVKILLRNRDRIPENLKIFSDQTPAQQKYLTKLKEQLASRKSNGEDDLTIKYINGTPTIVKMQKN